MKRACALSLLLFGWPSLSLAAKGNFTCETGSKICVINISSQTPSQDDKSAGPKKIIVKGANTLRYDYVFNPTVSFTAGPSIDLFTLGTSSKVSTTPQSTKETQKAQDTAMSTASVFFAEVVKEKQSDEEKLDQLEQDTNLQLDLANNATHLVNDASEDMQNLLTTSDSILRTGGDAVGQAALKSEIHARRIDQGSCPGRDAGSARDASALPVLFQRGVCAIWPDLPTVARLLTDAKNLKTNVQDDQRKAQARIQSSDADLAALNQSTSRITEEQTKRVQTALQNRKSDVILVSQYDDELKRLDTVISDLGDINSDGKKYRDFANLQTNLRQWNQRMIALAQMDDPFSLPPQQAPCNFAFSQTKTTKEALARTDRFSSGVTATSSATKDSTSSKNSTAVTTIPLITVECTAPFSLSAGFAFSAIAERDFVIQPAPNASDPTKTTNRFTTDAHSNFRPLPIAMVNMRYHEFNDFWALYGSFGVAANIKGQSAGGSDPEYLFSPITFGFFRTAFVTPALHIGRDVNLGSGFHEGDVVPSNITTPPLQKKYRPTFALAITLSKP